MINLNKKDIKLEYEKKSQNAQYWFILGRMGHLQI